MSYQQEWNGNVNVLGDNNNVGVVHSNDHLLQDLRTTNPRLDKTRIEATKGGLLKDSYRWILDHSKFQQWRVNQTSKLLWIQGDPGKGKTMLLCGIIDELSIDETNRIAYFFCQATDKRLDNATAVLRGLISMLVEHQPSLISYVQKMYNQMGRTVFEDPNAWYAVSETFMDILQDEGLRGTYLIIDALDECLIDLPRLLEFVVEKSLSFPVQWLVSSRNRPHINEWMDRTSQKTRLCLELNPDAISKAVSTYIRQNVKELVELKKYNQKTRDAVLEHLTLHANDTFLWVALVCQKLKEIRPWQTISQLKVSPRGLDCLYLQMKNQICDSDDADFYKRILALVAIVYRPITLQELISLLEMPEDMTVDLESLGEMISLCGSFLTIREDTVYFVHQSAKDFLVEKSSDIIFPSGREDVHRVIFSRSIDTMTSGLKQDMYQLQALGYPIEEVCQPQPDPLAGLRYSCIYWVDHLYDCSSEPSTHSNSILGSGGIVVSFLREKYLYWLEAMSLCRNMSKGASSIFRLEELIKERTPTDSTMDVVRDARRFIMYHKPAIESSPLQAYVALLFSPTRSIIRELFEEKKPKNIEIKQEFQDQWSNCVQTLEGHSGSVYSVVFSHYSAWLASASADQTVKIWDARNGECLHTLKDHREDVVSVAFSHDSTLLASVSRDNAIKIWSTRTGECLNTLEGHNSSVNIVVFSHDSTRLASVSYKTVQIWDPRNGECLYTLKRNTNMLKLVAFFHDSTRLISASYDGSVKTWSICNGEYSQIISLPETDILISAALSRDSEKLVTVSTENGIKIWETCKGVCLKTIDIVSLYVRAIAFSHDSTLITVASEDYNCKTWDWERNECVQTFEGHVGVVNSVVFSHDSSLLASASDDCNIRLWEPKYDVAMSIADYHITEIETLIFSRDSTLLATVSNGKIDVWDAKSLKLLSTFNTQHIFPHAAMDFSYDSTKLAFLCRKGVVKVVDPRTGKCLSLLEDYGSPYSPMTFSSNSFLLASSFENIVQVSDTGSRKCRFALEGHSAPISSLAFCPESIRLASGSRDGIIKIWDTNRHTCLQTLEGDGGDVTSLCFCSASIWLASVTYNCIAKVWDLSSGNCNSSVEVHPKFRLISFDSIAMVLYTDFGTVNVSAQHQSRYLCMQGSWLTYNGENLLWVPPDFRPKRSVVSGNVMANSARNGRVWSCEVSGRVSL